MFKKCIHHSNNTRYSQILIIAQTLKALDFFTKAISPWYFRFTHKKHPRGASIHRRANFFPVKPTLMYLPKSPLSQNIPPGLSALAGWSSIWHKLLRTPLSRESWPLTVYILGQQDLNACCLLCRTGLN